MTVRLTDPITIGDVVFPNRLALAPLEGLTHLPFRRLCRREGAGMVCTEMAVGMALAHGSTRERALLVTTSDESPVMMQVMAHEPGILETSARILEASGAAVLNLNLGCPSPTVVSSGGGAAMLKDLRAVGDAVRALVRAATRPVTVKIRAGWDAGHRNAPEAACIAEAEGALAVFLHARTREDRFRPIRSEEDWVVIAETVARVNIPVYGNGGVAAPEDALRMMRDTGCAGVMIGTGAVGNPWIFRRTLRLAETGEPGPEPGPAERLSAFLEHARAWALQRGERVGVMEMRKFAAQYTKGLPRASEFRQRVNVIETLAELETATRHYARAQGWEGSEMGICVSPAAGAVG